jgi:hypothetical protein
MAGLVAGLPEAVLFALMRFLVVGIAAGGAPAIRDFEPVIAAVAAAHEGAGLEALLPESAAAGSDNLLNVDGRVLGIDEAGAFAGAGPAGGHRPLAAFGGPTEPVALTADLFVTPRGEAFAAIRSFGCGGRWWDHRDRTGSE